MLDKSKVPSDLVVHRVWEPDDPHDTRRPIAYASERNRRVIGAALIALGTTLAVAALMLNVAFSIAFLLLLVAWAGAAYGGGGRTGFYRVNDDGGLGEYLGRVGPDLSSMRPRRPFS